MISSVERERLSGYVTITAIRGLSSEKVVVEVEEVVVGGCLKGEGEETETYTINRARAHGFGGDHSLCLPTAAADDSAEAKSKSKSVRGVARAPFKTVREEGRER